MTARKESVDEAIARLEKKVGGDVRHVTRLSDDAVFVRVGTEAATVSFDAKRHHYELSEFDPIKWESLGPGDRFPGGWSRMLDGTSVPSTILAGRGVSGSLNLVHEPATGKLEVAPNSPLTRFLHEYLVLQGWHHHVENHPAKTIRLIILSVVAIFAFAILFMLTVALSAWLSGA
ncbi:MAG: hypothetical protein QM809_12305 [Gordonia sp. (in: high G+C Gram-positive bacteria)]|uniref:hypothetical protein n=1 Tax=Gordonia sp. (in: high G+C Gram-positive bacteria) TaxID=84139 RepID=UPI0039E446DB